MLLLFGIRTRERLLSRRTEACEVCGVLAAQALVRRSTRFTLFFVPLFPVRPGTLLLACAHCGARRPADPRTARLAA